MKVLITGGYGFIGSHVAEQFYQEGYEIHIIDNLSTGKKENVSCPHKSYILGIEDPKCKSIFSSYNFDVVVHLAAQVSVAKSIDNPKYDAQLNIVGLIHILQLAKQHGVKKFIFASSAAVYGNNMNLPLDESQFPNPISPYGISKWVGEKYCMANEEHADMQVICFRFSNVYGPRQTVESEGGVISIFTDLLLKNEPLLIYGDGGQTRDFIYVRDIALAIYRASQSILSGIYNLSTNTENSLLNIIDILEKIHGPIERQFTSVRNGDIYRSSLSNNRLKTDLDWSPLFTLEEGLHETYEWAKNNASPKTKKTEVKRPKLQLPKSMHPLKPYAENLAIFLIFSTILLFYPNPIISTFLFGVFYIMIIGSIYGNSQGFVGVVLAASLLVTEYLINGRNIVSLLYDTTFLFQISMYLFIGLIIGYSVQRKNTIITNLQDELSELQKRYVFLETLHSEIRDIKDELQMRLKNNEDSFGKIYSIIKELDDLEPEKIFSKTVKVVERIMRCKEVSIYMLDKDKTFLHLVAYSDSHQNSKIKNTIKVDESLYVQQMLITNQIFVNRQLLPDSPLLAAPVYYNNEIHAIITINDLSFEQLSNYHENLFIVIKELIQTSLWRASEFIKITENMRYIENTNVLKYETFNEILLAKKEAQHSSNMPFTLFKIPIMLEHLQATAQGISKLLRETDYLGFKDDILYILLSNTDEENLPFILHRFKEAGFMIDENQKVSV